MPYYFYMCDMIPFSRALAGLASREAQELQHAIMGYLPGFATPRIVCDVPFVGKRWVHQLDEYDRERGISYWTKNYRTVDRGRRRRGADAATYAYYDPIDTLPAEGQDWWAEHAATRSADRRATPRVPRSAATPSRAPAVHELACREFRPRAGTELRAAAAGRAALRRRRRPS